MSHVEQMVHRPAASWSFKGSRKNKFAILSVEEPVRQGAKAMEYQDISSFRNATGRKCMGA
jgi:hypothetical protein